MGEILSILRNEQQMPKWYAGFSASAHKHTFSGFHDLKSRNVFSFLQRFSSFVDFSPSDGW